MKSNQLKRYAILGYKCIPVVPGQNLRDEGFLIYFEPEITDLHSGVENALAYCCERITIYLILGEDPFREVVRLVQRDVRIRRNMWGNRSTFPPVGKETVWEIVGRRLRLRQVGGQSTTVVFSSNKSSSPESDVKKSFLEGADEVTLEVRRWKKGVGWPKPHKMTPQGFFEGVTPK